MQAVFLFRIPVLYFFLIVLYHSEMKLHVFVLNKKELLKEVISAYVEAGVPGATIIDSEGLGHFLTHKIPLFADFKNFMTGNTSGNKTIFSVVKDESVLPQLEKLLDRICGGLSAPGTGIIFTIPLDSCKGFTISEGI